MKRVFIFSLLLIVPAVVMPFAAHWILEGELARGKELGTAYLKAQAELATAAVAGRHALPNGTAAGTAITDKRVEIGDAPPKDSRCFGVSSAADGRKVYAWWRGDVPQGELHKRRIHSIEISVYAVSSAFFLIGIGLLMNSLNRARAEAKRQREFTADFTHRLKTPLTSISLCAELARSGRLPPEKIAESTETIVREAEKLNGIVDEVLGFMKDPHDD